VARMPPLKLPLMPMAFPRPRSRNSISARSQQSMAYLKETFSISVPCMKAVALWMNRMPMWPGPCRWSEFVKLRMVPPWE
jgi:hypothetical protein